MTNPPLIIGLLGGVACGKSTVAQMLEELGAAAVDADRIAHRALDTPAVAGQIRETWGEAVFDAEGRVDRGKLGQRVFQNSGETQKLNAIVHPPVLDEIRNQIDAARKAGAPAVVVDAALLLEAGFARECDVLVFVDTPAAQRQARAQEGRGWSRDEVERREAHQTSLDDKRAQADYVLCNSGSLDDLRVQVRALWQELLGAPAGGS